MTRTDASAPTVVLVHGLSGSRRWWQPTLAALNRDHRVEVPELRGFGARRRSGRFRLSSAADELADELSEMELGQVDVVGHSMGGLVAAQLAADHPERVSRLVLVAAPLVPFPWGVGRHAVNLARTVPALAPRFRRILAADAIRTNPVNLLSTATQLLHADLTDRWDRIQAPTLLVWGTRDTIVPPLLGRLAEERIRDSRYVELEGAGHVPMWERPREFNELLRSFLDGPPGA